MGGGVMYLSDLRGTVQALHDEEPWSHLKDMLTRHIVAARRQAFREVLDLIDDSGKVKQNAENLNFESPFRPNLEYRLAAYTSDGRQYTAPEHAVLCDQCGAVVVMPFVHQAFHEAES